MTKQSYIVAFWSPLAASRPHFCLDFFIPFLQKYGDIQCLDLQSRQDARSIRLLRQADLVIIGLPPIPAAFHRYFCDNWIPFSKVCYAFLDYLPALQTDVQHICHTYRLAEPSVMRIPYNICFREAVRSGQSHDYLKEELPQYKTTDFHLCIQELTRSGKLILKTLDENLLIRSNGSKSNHHI